MNILVIDDDPVYRELARSILKQRYSVFAVEFPSLAFKILKNENIDIIICDFQLPEMNGLQVLQKVKAEYPEIEVIMISSSDDMNTVIGALREGAVDYYKKPFTASDLWISIERTKKFTELNSELIETKKKHSFLKSEVDREMGLSIVGNSSDISEIKHQMEMVAQTPDTSVLIIGESGTGKELVARGIHNLSNRKGESFGAVNMSAVPESLFESEFFGHKKGSFTGAISDKAGWFESVNSGTLFFDEIGEMSMSMQVKLLRVLEDRKFTKVGTQTEQSFDLRIVAATNKTVEQLTDGKNFRLDLFHRLGIFVIQLPSLRERKEDIPLLAEYYLNNLSKKMGKHISKINQEVFELLNNYTFPGNIRELKNLIERAIIVCQGSELLPLHFSIFSSNCNFSKSDESINTFDLKELEKHTILKALQKVNYNKSEAARLLNLEWNALYRRIQKYNIKFPSE